MQWSYEQLECLLSGEKLSERCLSETSYRTICVGLERDLKLKSRIEWCHYGSGYASYVDAWFSPTGQPGSGLVVLLSRLSHYFVMMQGSKSWSKGQLAASSYLPHSSMTDQFEDPEISKLVGPVQRVLEGHGLIRLDAADLDTPLPAGTQVATILGDPPFTQWDALFYWED